MKTSRELMHRLYRAFPRPPSTNLRTGQFRADLMRDLPSGAVVLDVGAKDDRGKRSLAQKQIKYVALDIAPAIGIDIVADGHSIPLRSNCADRVFCVGVLMCCADPKQVVAEMFRVLKPGGIIYIGTAFVFRLAADPFDYYRFSAEGLRVLCEKFEPIQSGFNRGPASTMADMLSHFFALVWCFNRKPVYDVLVDVFQWCFFWLKYLDKILNRYSMAGVIHSGDFFVGRKPLRSATDLFDAHADELLLSARSKE